MCYTGSYVFVCSLTQNEPANHVNLKNQSFNENFNTILSLTVSIFNSFKTVLKIMQ